MKLPISILLILLCSTVHGQGFISIGADSHPGINLYSGYRIKSGFQFTAGYSAPIKASQPQILTIAAGKVISFPTFEIIPSIGLSRYKRDTIFNNYRIDGRILYPVFAAIEINKQVVFGNIHANLNYCKGFYVSIGITAFFGDLKPAKKNIWQGEHHWYIPERRELIAYGLYSLSGVAKGVHDAMVFHHWGTGRFFGPEQWKNKWKGNPADKVEAFPLSSTALVIFTDGVHSSNVIDVAGMASATVINFWNIKEELQQYPKGTRVLAFVAKKIIYPIIFRAVAFEAVWRNLKP